MYMSNKYFPSSCMQLRNSCTFEHERKKMDVTQVAKTNTQRSFEASANASETLHRPIQGSQTQPTQIPGLLEGWGRFNARAPPGLQGLRKTTQEHAEADNP